MALIDGARTAIYTCMGVKRGEVVLILTDTEKEVIGEALYEVAKEAKAEAIIARMLPRTRHGEEPPRMIAEMMKHADVIVAPTLGRLEDHKNHNRNRNRFGGQC